MQQRRKSMLRMKQQMRSSIDDENPSLSSHSIEKKPFKLRESFAEDYDELSSDDEQKFPTTATTATAITKELWIDLAGKYMSLLPNELLVGPSSTNFRMTTKLTLRNNRFTDIPEAFGLMSVLKEMDFCDNAIVDISNLNKFKSTKITKLW